MKKSPFFLMMDYKPWDIPIAFERTNVPTVDERLCTLKEVWNKAITAYELARQKMTVHLIWGFTPFNVGDKVWLDGQNLKTGLSYQKFILKHFGFFEITEALC